MKGHKFLKVTGIAIPALYIYGAVLNSKADTQ